MAVNSFNAQNPPVTTKGDVFTFSTIPTRLGVGANNTVLTADSSTATGLKWAAAGGKVLQVVYANYSTETTIASTTFTDTGLSASITPSATSSKIYVIATQVARVYRDSGNENGIQYRLLRGTTSIFDQGGSANANGLSSMGGGGTGLSTFLQIMQVPITYLDSPSTTSSTTYKIQGRVNTTANGGGMLAQNYNSTSSITLIEVAG